VRPLTALPLPDWPTDVIDADKRCANSKRGTLAASLVRHWGLAMTAVEMI
jgi:hypothetical protein